MHSISLELTRNWFPAKEASFKHRYILELLYNLHEGHDPSILPANSKSEPPHCGVSTKNDQDNESKNVIESCNWRKPFDGSSSTGTVIPLTKTCSPDLILSKEKFNTGGDDPQSPKLRKVFLSPIVEKVDESGEEKTHLAMDIQESTGHEVKTLEEYVSDSQYLYEVAMKGEDDDDELLITGDSTEGQTQSVTQPTQPAQPDNAENSKSNMCHQCQRNDKGRVVRCQTCHRKRYCIPCLRTWYPRIAEENIAKKCPFCWNTCNCKACLRLDTKIEEISSDLKVSKEETIRCSKYIVQWLLPHLKEIDDEQIAEKNIEAKISGTFRAELR